MFKNEFNIINILYKYGTLLTIFILIVIFAMATDGRFLKVANLINILRAMSITAVIASGVTLSLVVGGFDLSVGSVASMSMAVVISMFIWFDQNVIFGLIVALAVGAAIGLFNSFFIITIKIPDDILVTLASLFIFNGVAMTYSKGKILSQNMIMPDGSTSIGTIPEIFRSFGRVPYIIIIMFLVIFILHVFLNFTKHGRFMYSVGANAEAARLSGVKVKKYKMLAYVLSGTLAAFGGILLAARMGQSNPSGGAGYLMEAVAAVFIGYSVLGAGKANAIGTFIGALLMAILSNGLVMLSVPYYSMDIVKGSVLVIAIYLTYYERKKKFNLE